MNWLHRHIKSAQGTKMPLTLASLHELYDSQLSETRDVPGQQYLFTGPEWSELANIRSGDISATTVGKLLNLFNLTFEMLGDNLYDEYDYDREIDDMELDEEMRMYAESYVNDYDFFNDNRDNDPLYSFLRYIEPDGVKDAVLRSFPSKFPSEEDLKELLPALKEREEEVTTFYKTYANRGFAPEMEYSVDSIVRGWQEGAQAEADGYDGVDEFLEPLADFTTEVLLAIADSNTLPTHRHSLFLDEDVPSWVNKAEFNKQLTEMSELEDWYIEQNRGQYGGLEDSSYESIRERDSEYFGEKTGEWEHQFGFDILELLSSEFDPEEEEDYRRDIDLSDLSSMITTMNDFASYVRGGDVLPKATSLVFAMQMLAESNDVLSEIFGSSLSQINLSPETIQESIEMVQDDSELLHYFQGIPQFDQIIAEIKRKEEERNRMLPLYQETSTPEQLERMKELGIAKRPFAHETQLQRGKFPGAGFATFTKGQNLIPFTMSIAPTNEYVGEGEGRIPEELIEDTLLHTIKTDRMPALGWIGGYADYIDKVLYIAEAQSDLMQRTIHMRNPVKVRVQRREEVETIQKQIAEIESKIQNASSPRRNMEQKIQRITQETQDLEMRQLNGDQSVAGKIQQNRQLINRLQQQLPNVPEGVDTANLRLTLVGLQQSLEQAKARLAEAEDASGGVADNQFSQKYRKWHDYKSKVENTFKEWVPVFFNAAFRLARDKGYTTVRIASAKALNSIWSRFAGDKTEDIFKRIYDQTAKFYGGSLINLDDKQWWEIKMNPDLRIASWLKRLTKTANHEWLTQIPGGKFVWQLHLDKYFEVMRKEAPELAETDEFGYPRYEADENRQAIFQYWLTQVPEELKLGDDLEPNFKQQARQYAIETQGFDPYSFEPEEPQMRQDDIDIPSAEELEQWFT